MPQAGDVSRVTSGCNAEIRNTFLSGGSLLDNVGSRMGLPGDYIDLIRGLVGDVNLKGSMNAYKVSYEAPCTENNPDDIKAFTSGEVYAKDTWGNCRQITDTNRDLRQYVRTSLVGIANKIENKGTLNTTEQAFLTTNPLATLPILKIAVGRDT